MTVLELQNYCHDVCHICLHVTTEYIFWQFLLKFVDTRETLLKLDNSNGRFT